MTLISTLDRFWLWTLDSCLLDLLYIAFCHPEQKVAEAVTIRPGVHADFSGGGKLVGLEVIDASEVLGERLEFGVQLEALLAQSPLHTS